MGVFNKIFDFTDNKNKKLNHFIENREHARYLLGEGYPLSVYLKSPQNSEKISCTIKNISIEGLRLNIEQEGICQNGDDVTLEFDFLGNHFELTGEVKYSGKGATEIGLKVDLQNYQTSNNFMQCYLPIAIGASLKEIPEQNVSQNEKNYFKRLFSGTGGSELLIWTDLQDKSILKGFELITSEYIIRKSEKHKKAQFFVRPQDESSIHINIHASTLISEEAPQDKAKEMALFSKLIFLNYQGPFRDDFLLAVDLP